MQAEAFKVVRSEGRSGGRNCRGWESVTGKVRADDHDDVKASGVRDRYGSG